MEIFNTDNLDDKIHTMMLNGAKIWVRFFPGMSFADFRNQLKKRCDECKGYCEEFNSVDNNYIIHHCNGGILVVANYGCLLEKYHGELDDQMKRMSEEQLNN